MVEEKSVGDGVFKIVSTTNYPIVSAARFVGGAGSQHTTEWSEVNKLHPVPMQPPPDGTAAEQSRMQVEQVYLLLPQRGFQFSGLRGQVCNTVNP